MGADIHDYCEVQKPDGTWEMLGKVFENPYYREEDPIDGWNTPKTEHPYKMRNYALFGFLAAVRGDEVPPLAEPRGVPTDASEDYKKLVNDELGCDGHSASYFTLKELLDYPLYHEPATREGYVTLDEYRRFKEQGSPNGWCGGVGGGRVVHLSNEEMDKLIADPDYVQNHTKELFGLLRRGNARYPVVMSSIDEMERLYETEGKLPDLHFYTHITWQQKVSDCLGVWWFKTLDQMKALAPDGDYNKIRYVFFFDN